MAAQLNGGRVTASVEVSNDGFVTVLNTNRVAVPDGVTIIKLEGISDMAHAVRLRFDLARGPDVATTPIVDAFRIRADAD